MVTNQGIQKLFKKCRINTSDLSIDWMQKDKFEAPEKLLISINSSDEVQCSTNSKIGAIESPDARKNSVEYYKLKLAAAKQRIKELSGQSLYPDEVPGFYTIEKVKEKQSTTSKAKRITQVHGSLEGTEILA